MTDWLWQHVAGPAINGTFALIPTWVWIIVAALAFGWAWRTFGWQGLVSVGLAVLTLGAYRKGWQDRDSLAHEHVDGPDALPSASVEPSARPRAAGVAPSTARPPDDLPPKSLTER